MDGKKEILNIGGYQVERAESFAGIRVWAFHALGKIYPAFYLGCDPVANKYFFTTRNDRFRRTKGDPDVVLVYSEENLNQTFFHPMLLDLNRIAKFKEEESA